VAEMVRRIYEKHPKLVQFGALLVAFFLLNALINHNETNVLWRLPALLSALPGVINDLAENLMFNWFPIEVYDPDLDDYEQKALVRELTRGFSRVSIMPSTGNRRTFEARTANVPQTHCRHTML